MRDLKDKINDKEWVKGVLERCKEPKNFKEFSQFMALESCFDQLKSVEKELYFLAAFLRKKPTELHIMLAESIVYSAQNIDRVIIDIKELRDEIKEQLPKEYDDVINKTATD